MWPCFTALALLIPLAWADFRSGPGLVAQGSVDELTDRANMMVTVISVASSSGSVLNLTGNTGDTVALREFLWPLTRYADVSISYIAAAFEDDTYVLSPSACTTAASSS